jgi:hypothetical protein
LPPATASESEIRVTTVPIVAPRFNIAPVAHSIVLHAARSTACSGCGSCHA